MNKNKETTTARLGQIMLKVINALIDVIRHEVIAAYISIIRQKHMDFAIVVQLVNNDWKKLFCFTFCHKKSLCDLDIVQPVHCKTALVIAR